MATDTTTENGPSSSQEAQTHVNATTEYCAKTQEWTWQYYWGGSMQIAKLYKLSSADWNSVARRTTNFRYPIRYNYRAPDYGYSDRAADDSLDTASYQQQNGNAPETSLVYTTPSPLHRFLAETVDFFVLFCVKATIILWIMHLSGMKDIMKFITHFIVEEMDENTSMEDLQKMMAVALDYRVLVSFCEIFWGLGSATAGKILLGLQVVTCDSSVLVRPNRVLVVPESNVTLSAPTVRALNKNFSIAFLFSIFTTFFLLSTQQDCI